MNTTRQLSERITEAIDNIPNGFRAIDRDKLLNDIRDLYDQVLDLEPTTNEITTTPEPVVAKEPEIIPAPTPVPAPEPVIMAQPEMEVEIVETEPIEETVVETMVETQPVVENDPATVESQKTVETDADEGTLAGKLTQKPTSDLRTGIPLNEKFSLIQNLFQNNASDYADAILKLNGAEDQAMAISYFDKKAERRGWDMEDAQVRAFRNYVERRHLAIANTSEANADQ